MGNPLEANFNIWRTSRKQYLEYLDNYSLEQLNKVPTGFSNNLIWNIGHVIVAQQSLIYRSSGLPANISDEMFDLYRPGTRPTGQTTQEEVDEMRVLLTALITQTEADLDAGIFKEFSPRMTGSGFYLNDLMDAFEFNNYHEGMHLGVMMSIRKFL